MAKVFNVEDLTLLKKMITERGDAARKAAALTVNQSAIFAMKESIKEITSSVNLKESYVQGHMAVAGKATPNSLKAEVYANERGTLLTRYPFNKTAQGVSVAINKGRGYREIPQAFMVKSLRGSNAQGIALRNTEALKLYEAVGGSSGAKKLSRLRAKAKSKPSGIHVLHSRSINQLFTSARDDINPELTSFMLREFMKNMDRF
ncbi:hypothetical protein A134_23115 [Vibrio crassostreae 9CS106]|uniref:Uncharacterized protein n=1 Tax=Vibrio crassostreae 9CS106 TaxID=1191300 RepID=A0A1B1C3D5_9VIBR|nr:hypothetical protein A134_23115 [Vibrio crassostreae 9CS106]